MRNLLFVFIFLVSVSSVYTDLRRNNTELALYGCPCTGSASERLKDTLKVVRDTTFKMSMSTNNPFNNKRHFYINLSAFPDTSCCYPLTNSKVISDYGSRGGRKHTGVDIKTFPNDSIYAAFSGMVVMSSAYFGYGNCIILRHPNGLETLYSHNSKNLVGNGAYVHAGQVIALTGRTGRATTEHLHFECRIKGCSFNPNLIFDHSKEKINSGLLKFTNNGKGIGAVLYEDRKSIK